MSSTAKHITVDGCEATALVAYKVSEVAIIYPITPSSPMGESTDAWAAVNKPNIWGTVPFVQEMQSEGGAAGSVHGALQTGSLTTTFTASQGLLLMIPNMFKIAGELTSTVFHVTARAIATSALSIFGDQSDVMAARSTGWAMLFSNSVQEAADMALISHASTLEGRVPFMHIFDGFRTSHEVMKITPPTDEEIRAMISDDLVAAHRARALSPDRPFIRGTAQNPDVYFQTREAVNPYYNALPSIVQKNMDKLGEMTGRKYQLFQYIGAPDADRIIIAMGSGCEAIEETVEHLNAKGAKLGLLKIRLFRPFSISHFIEAIPASVKKIAVIDRTKEPGSLGEPLYQDVVSALSEVGRHIKTVGGRYGISSKEFTPAMVKGIYDELAKPEPKNHFTIGINDDVTHTSLDVDYSFQTESHDTFRGVFWGLGADGTVGANKNSIKIIGDETDLYAQGYFVYDSKKSGARTVSYLRFGKRPIRSTYLIQSSNFIAIHQFNFVYTYPVLATASEGAIVLLNSPFSAEEVWDQLPLHFQKTVLEKKLKLFVVDAYAVAKETGMGGRMNTILQTCFFAISKVLPPEQAIAAIKKAIKKTYGKRGEAVVQKNIAAVDASLARLKEVQIPDHTNGKPAPALISDKAPEFVRTTLRQIIAEEGDLLPVSAMPADGTFPSATSQWEKRGLALQVPVWDPQVCIQCGKCVMVCPHATIRSKIISNESVSKAPEGFRTAKAKWKEIPDALFTIQVAVEDCTGCTLCVEVCPAKNRSQANRKAINMEDMPPIREQGRKDWDFFMEVDDVPESQRLPLNLVRNVQTRRPLFEFSGACAGCGETPYVKLVSQIYGDRALIANATGCSSIYGGNLPTTPWAQNAQGRGPAWSNSLFEDNAEFGFGMRITLNQQIHHASRLLKVMQDQIGVDLVAGILTSDQSNDEGIAAQRARIVQLKEKLSAINTPQAKDLSSISDNLVKKSVWIMGGDGWAYDIGYGGLDHVLAQGLNVNILILDTQVYSNTGGQSSKATPLGAVAKFASAGKRTGRKDIGLMAMSYGNIYVGQVAFGADDAHTLRTFQEAEAYEGPSLIIAYAHCIAHGIIMEQGLKHQKLAVQSGAWPLYRYNPALKDQGKNPFSLDSKAPTIPMSDYMKEEGRFRILAQGNPDMARTLTEQVQKEVEQKLQLLQRMAAAPSAAEAAAQPTI